MSWIADAHRDWHYAYGKNNVCPLDCGVGEAGCPGCGDVDCRGDCEGLALDYDSEAQGIYPEFSF